MGLGKADYLVRFRDCILRKSWCRKVTRSWITHLAAVHYTKGNGWSRIGSLLLVEHICICLLIFKTTNRKREREGGEGRGES
jgi:hypothetical protein